MRSPWLAAACVLAEVLVLGGCPRGGERGPRAGRAEDGLTIAIYSGLAPASAGPAAATPMVGELRERQIRVYEPPVAQPVAPPVTPPRAVRSFAVIDDRRTIEVDRDGVLRLGEVAGGIELASLVIEPLDGRRLVVTSCAREQGGATIDPRARVVTADGVEVVGRVVSTGGGVTVIEDEAGHAHFVKGAPDRITVAEAFDVRCQVEAAAGEHRVRLAYATRDLGWRAAYRADATVTGDGAAAIALQPTYTITGGDLLGHRTASVSLLIGLPGGDETPRAAWTGPVTLGDQEVSVRPPARTLQGRLEHVYRGAISHKDDNPRVDYWRNTMTPDVWVSLGIDPAVAADHADLAAGAVLVEVSRDGEVRQAHARWEPAPAPGRGVDVRLWPADDVIGFRERRTPYQDGTRLVEQYLFSVANHGAHPVRVWVEEELRPGASAREVRRAWPVKPKRSGDLLRFAIDVKPGGIERLGFEAEYRW